MAKRKSSPYMSPGEQIAGTVFFVIYLVVLPFATAPLFRLAERLLAVSISPSLQNAIYYYTLFAVTILIFHGFIGRTTRNFADNLGNACKAVVVGLVDLAAVDIHECSGIAVTDPVTQSAEATVHVNIRHRSDPLGIIPDPGAELVVTVICQDRRHVHVDFPPIPPDPENHGFSSGRVHGIDQSVLIF